LHRVRAIRLLAESEEVGAERAGDLAHETLRQAMGLETTAELEVADQRLSYRKQHLELSAILDEAMIRRPELAKARVAVRIAELERELAKANYLPDVGLFGRFGTIDDDGGFANPNDREEWAVGLTLGVPLYTGGRPVNQKRQAAFRQAQARHAGRLARNLIALEVQKTYLEYLEMSKRLPLAKAAVDAAEGTIQGLRNDFVADLVEEQEMPDYYENLTQAHILLALARSKYYTTIYRYDLALARIRLVTASSEHENLY